MKTINQINGNSRRILSFWEELKSERNYRERYFKYKIYKDRDSREEPATNFVLSTMLKEHEAAGYIGDFYKPIHTNIEGYHVYFTYDVSIRGGAKIKIINSDFCIFANREEIIIRSHQTPQEFNPVEYLHKEAEKRMYKPGFFRDIQIFNNKTKKQAAEAYKDWLAYCKQKLNTPVNKQEQIEISLKKRLKKANILLDQNELYNERELRRAMQIGRLKTRKTLAIASNPWDVYEEAISNFDTEEEIMQYAEDVYINNKPNKYIYI